MGLPISVVMPAFNSEKNIGEAIDSVLAQTLKNFELIVIDDGSTDDTLKIVKEYSQKDERVIVVAQKNQGASIARNSGIMIARGKYIAFLDSDDIWKSKKLETHFNHLEGNEDIGMSFARVTFMMPDGSPTKVISSAKLKNITPQDFLFGNLAVTTSNSVCRKDAIVQVGSFDQEFKRLGYEDVDLFLRIICCDWVIEGIDDPLVFYRLSESGASSKLEDMLEGWQLLVKKVRVFAPELVEDNYKYAKANMLQYLSRRALRLGLNGKVALKYSLLSLQTDWTLVVREPKRTIAIFIASLLSALSILPKNLSALK